MTLWAKRTDSNHTEIRDAMRSMGAQVFDLSGAGKGAPDTIVNMDGRILLVEIKTPTGKLTKAQVDFHSRFPVHIVRCIEDIQLLLTTPNQ